MNDHTFQLPHGIIPFADIPLMSRPKFMDRFNLEMSMIAGMLQQHKWLDTLDDYVVAEPVPPMYTDTYLVKNEKMKQELMDTMNRLAKANKTIEEHAIDTQAQIEAFDFAYNAYQNKIEELLASLDSRTSSHEETVVAYTAQVQEFENRLRNKALEIEKLKSTVASLEENIQSLENEIDVNVSRTVEYQQREQELKDKLSFLEESLYSFMPRTTDLYSPQLRSLIESNASQELKVKNQQIASLKDDLVAQANQSAEKQQQLREQLNSLEVEKQKFISEQTSLRNQVIELQSTHRNELRQYSLEIERLQAERNQLVEKLTERKRLQKQSADLVAEGKRQMQVQQQIYQDAKQQLAIANNEKQQLEQELVSANKKLRAFSTSNSKQMEAKLLQRIAELEQINLKEHNNCKDKGITFYKSLGVLFKSLTSVTKLNLEEIVNSLNGRINANEFALMKRAVQDL